MLLKKRVAAHPAQTDEEHRRHVHHRKPHSSALLLAEDIVRLHGVWCDLAQDTRSSRCIAPPRETSLKMNHVSVVPVCGRYLAARSAWSRWTLDMADFTGEVQGHLHAARAEMQRRDRSSAMGRVYRQRVKRMRDCDRKMASLQRDIATQRKQLRNISIDLRRLAEDRAAVEDEAQATLDDIELLREEVERMSKRPRVSLPATARSIVAQVEPALLGSPESPIFPSAFPSPFSSAACSQSEHDLSVSGIGGSFHILPTEIILHVASFLDLLPYALRFGMLNRAFRETFDTIIFPRVRELDLFRFNLRHYRPSYWRSDSDLSFRRNMRQDCIRFANHFMPAVQQFVKRHGIHNSLRTLHLPSGLIRDRTETKLTKLSESLCELIGQCPHLDLVTFSCLDNYFDMIKVLAARGMHNRKINASVTTVRFIMTYQRWDFSLPHIGLQLLQAFFPNLDSVELFFCQQVPMPGVEDSLPCEYVDLMTLSDIKALVSRDHRPCRNRSDKKKAITVYTVGCRYTALPERPRTIKLDKFVLTVLLDYLHIDPSVPLHVPDGTIDRNMTLMDLAFLQDCSNSEHDFTFPTVRYLVVEKSYSLLQCLSCSTWFRLLTKARHAERLIYALLDIAAECGQDGMLLAPIVLTDVVLQVMSKSKNREQCFRRMGELLALQQNRGWDLRLSSGGNAQIYDIGLLSLERHATLRRLGYCARNLPFFPLGSPD